MRTIYPLVVLAVLSAVPAAAHGVDAQSKGPLQRAQIQRTQIAAMARQVFATMDTNHDGIVTPGEYASYRQKAGDAPADNPFVRVGGHWYDHADVKHDSRVTLDEALAYPLHAFDRADTNHDGVLSSHEQKVALKYIKHK
jgi:hypothetical protein